MMSRLLHDDELSLYSLSHIFGQCSAFYEAGKKDEIATFDLVVRELPPHRNFLLAGGLEAIIHYISQLRFSREQIDYLLHEEKITKGFADYLEQFTFTGDIDALPEGTVLFPGEIMVRVRAPIIEANLITDALISLGVIDTMLLSKLARISLVSREKKVGIGFVRAQGIDSGWRAGRNAFFFENMSTANTAITKRLNVQSRAVTVAYHAFIKSFDTELEAMRAITQIFPTNALVMIDTYDYVMGIAHAIIVAQELKEKGGQLFGIIIDSGDFLEIARYARAQLDSHDLQAVSITVTGNLDEYKLKYFIDNNIPAQSFLMVTEVVTCADAPTLEMVYKMAQLQSGNSVRNTAKFSLGKLSLPGAKQVYRKTSNGIIEKDTIGLEDEEGYGDALLVPIFRNGVCIYAIPTVEENRKYVSEQLSLLPQKYKDILYDVKDYPVVISKQIQEQLEELRIQHKARHT